MSSLLDTLSYEQERQEHENRQVHKIDTSETRFKSKFLLPCEHDFQRLNITRCFCQSQTAFEIFTNWSNLA